MAARDWRSGQSLNGEPTLRYPAPPSVSPDGRHVAYVAGGRLAIGRWNGVARLVARFTLKCRVLSWSDDSTRLLVPCGQSVEQWTGSGRLIRSPVSLGTPFWAPRSHSNLLFFRHGLLRVWRPGRPAEQIVRDAYPVSAYR